MNKKKSNRLVLPIVLAVIIVVLIIAYVQYQSLGSLENTFWALVPPVIAISLALITKEVYSSLFVGIAMGALLSAGFSLSQTMNSIVNDGLIDAASGNAGLYVFFVELGAIGLLMTKAGGSKAFGEWASTHVKTKIGASLATFGLGVLIFVDDYFNCLTVGSVMRPVTDEKKISRAKLAYLIDATAAPICMIAPVSSWAAAVAGSVDSETYSGLELFVRAIPFNYYSLLTIVFIITMSIMNFDYGKMKDVEIRAQHGDLIGNARDLPKNDELPMTDRGRIIDLVLPIVVLIVFCVFALVYVGGFFGVDAWGDTTYAGDFIGSFGNTDATIALPWGGLAALVITIVYMLLRRVVPFNDAIETIPQGFIAMVPPIIILTMATSLKNMTSTLGAKEYVAAIMASSAEGMFALLPAIIFIVAAFLSFATGTSWGTFGILIPIVTGVFPESSPLLFVGISACLAGAVCGDHMSPISDTTIMASAGAQCNHIEHVSTQAPYALTVAAISFVMYLLTGFFPNAYVMLPIGVVLTVGTLFVIKKKFA